MRRFGFTVGMTMLALLLTATAAPADSLRCSGGLVQTGDPAVVVRNTCGKPSFVDPWIAGASRGYGAAPAMEEWTYNRGPSRLLQILVFRDGKLYRIRNGGYGFRESSGDSACAPGAIQRGMSKYRLLQTCGSPAQRQSAVFVFSRRQQQGGRDYYRRRGYTPVYRERWIFNFGGNRLLREVTLENAVVVEVDTLDRGFDE